MLFSLSISVIDSLPRYVIAILSLLFIQIIVLFPDEIKARF